MDVLEVTEAVLWRISDDGTLAVRLSAQGDYPHQQARTMASEYLDRIVRDMTDVGIEVRTDEFRTRTYTTYPRVDIIWRATVPESDVETAREYLTRLAESLGGG